MFTLGKVNSQWFIIGLLSVCRVRRCYFCCYWSWFASQHANGSQDPFCWGFEKGRLRGQYFTENSFQCVLLSSLPFFHYENRDTSYHKTWPSHPHISDTISQWCSQQKHIGLQLIRLHQSSTIQGQSSKMALRSFYVIYRFYRWLPRNHLRIFETDNFGVLKVKYKGGGMNANYAYPPKVQIIFMIIAPWRMCSCAVLRPDGWRISITFESCGKCCAISATHMLYFVIIAM